MAAHAQLVAVWMHRQEIDPPTVRDTAAQRLVAAYCDLLVRRHRSGASMADLAEALGVTPTHLSRSCKQMCGLTAAEMQTQVTLHAARDLIAQGGPVGRKLDFLMQEFNREANTLCAKAQHGALTRTGLALKAVIDQMREQVQNVE